MNFEESGFTLSDLIMIALFALLFLVILLKKKYITFNRSVKKNKKARNLETDSDSDSNSDTSSRTSTKSTKSTKSTEKLLPKQVERELGGFSFEELGYPIL
jgi:hypothetical protein